MRYSIEPRYQIFVKDKVVSVNGKYSQKILDHAKQSAAMLCVQLKLLQVHLKLLP